MGAPTQIWAGGPQPGAPEYRRWVFEDAQGTGLLVTARRFFAPFGGVLEEVATEATEETYATHGGESASGLYYMQARWYDPGTGRFQSVDPVLRSLGEPQSHNAYSYVENEPVNSVDPTGEAGDVNIFIQFGAFQGSVLGGGGIGGFGGFRLCFQEGPQCKLGGLRGLGSIFSAGGILSSPGVVLPGVGRLGDPPLITRFLAQSEDGEGADDRSDPIDDLLADETFRRALDLAFSLIVQEIRVANSKSIFRNPELANTDLGSVIRRGDEGEYTVSPPNRDVQVGREVQPDAAGTFVSAPIMNAEAIVLGTEPIDRTLLPHKARRYEKLAERFGVPVFVKITRTGKRFIIRPGGSLEPLPR